MLGLYILKSFAILKILENNCANNSLIYSHEVQTDLISGRASVCTIWYYFLNLYLLPSMTSVFYFNSFTSLLRNVDICYNIDHDLTT